MIQQIEHSIKNWKYYSIFSVVITFPLVVWRKTTSFYRWMLMTIQKNFIIDPASKTRSIFWKLSGVKSNGSFRIGADVYYDAENARLLTIDDGVWISSRCTILCHKRDISNYGVGIKYSTQPTKVAPVHICRNAAIGMGSMIMPGVTIGEGAIVGSGSLVTKDVPAWTLVVGRPAKVVKTFNIQKL